MVAIASYRYKNASDGVVTDLETIDGLRYTRNNNQSITEGVSTTIDFDTVQQNVSGSADPLSSGVLTIPTAGVWRFDFAAGGQYGELLVVDEKAENSNGGDLGANPVVRDLNTVRKNTIAGASLATNTITLPPGTYDTEAYSTSYATDRMQISIRDTGNNILVQGMSDHTAAQYGGYSTMFAKGFFTINTTTNIRLILNRSSNIASGYEGGVGNNGNYGPEIFSLVHLKRVPGNLTLYKTPVATLSPLTYDSPILMGTYDASGGHQLVTCAKYDKIELKYNGYLIANSSDKKVFLSIEYRAGATTARAVGLIADDVTGVIETAGNLTVGNALTVTGKVGIGTNNPDSKVDITGSVITGITWNANTFTTRTSAADNQWLYITWAPELGLFIAVSDSGSGNRIMTSPDGINWTTRSTNDNNWVDITWAPELGLFVAVAWNGTGNRVMTSPDGINWTTRTSAADNEWMSITWAPELGLLVATSRTGTGNRVMTSPDGINWTTRTSAADSQWYGITWAPELRLLVAVAASGTGNRVMTSPDGINWTTRSTPVDNGWYDIIWAPELGLLVAVSISGTGNRVMTSPDGINWTTRTSAADNEWIRVTWAPELGLLVAVARTGTGNRVMTSQYGINWTTRSTPIDNEWWGITWAPELGLLAAVGYTGTGNRVMTASANTATSSILKAKEMKNSVEISNITVPYDTNYNRKLTIRGDTTISGNGIFPGKVGIGTNAPRDIIEVNGTIISNEQSPTIAFLGDIDGAKWLMKLGGYNLSFGTDYPDSNLDNGVETINYLSRTYKCRVIFTNQGFVGATGYKVRNGVHGSFGPNTFNIYWTGSSPELWIDLTNLGTISVSSDYRIKRNIKTQTACALDRIMALRPVTYQMNDYKNIFKCCDNIKEGFIAHEVQQVIPSGVEGKKDEENRIQNLRIDAILSVAVKAIQELKMEKDTTKAELETTKAELETTKEELQATKEELQANKEELQTLKSFLQNKYPGEL